MNRRDTFNAPLALAAFAAPSIAGASTESEILRLYAEWESKKKTCNLIDMDETTYDAAFADLIALEDMIIGLPSSTVAELAAKVLVADDGGDMATVSLNAERVVAEMRSLVRYAANETKEG